MIVAKGSKTARTGCRSVVVKRRLDIRKHTALNAIRFIDD